ncbi:MAG TPA: glycosyltransferase family 4 protein [Solirubrobacterales bacterium]
MNPLQLAGEPEAQVKARRTVRVALYGEVNMNLIDGSSVWVQSVAQMLTTLPWVRVTLLLRTAEERDVLTAPLRIHPRIELVEPDSLGHGGPLGAAEAIDCLQSLDAQQGFDLVLLRGRAVSEQICGTDSFAGRLWVYYLPPHDYEPGGEVEHLRLIAPSCERILCQTDTIKAMAAAAAAEHRDKVILLPPMIPAPPTVPPERAGVGSLKLLYAGKFAPEYYFLEMVETFRRLRRSHPEAELHVVGDKVHNPPDDPAFKPAAEAALNETENLVWHGGLSRDRAFGLMREADVALSVRHPMMDKELATKLLEYGAAGCAVILNRTPVYDQLLGPDYPLFATDPGEVLQMLAQLAEDPSLRASAAERCLSVSRDYSFDRVAARLAPELRDLVGTYSRSSRTDSRLHLVIAGHDLRFLGPIPAHAEASGARVRLDLWPGHDQTDKSVSGRLGRWSDTVFCEWCLGNSVWYSRNLDAKPRLVVRFHRQERETDFPPSVDVDRVHRIVFVGRHLLDEAAERYGWPEEKLMVVPNAIDVKALRRPKFAWSSFNLALVGYVPARKRLDRALDLIEQLRGEDGRFRLLLKGRPPWEYEWLWARPDERSYFEEQLRRIRASSVLRRAVSFEPYREGIGGFLQKAGFILSTSEHEGHQVAVAEGMASGCVPIILERPGAVEQYTGRWVHQTPEAAAAAVLKLTEHELLAAEQRRAGEFVQRWSFEEVMPIWDELLSLPSPKSEQPGQAARQLLG